MRSGNRGRLRGCAKAGSCKAGGRGPGSQRAVCDDPTRRPGVPRPPHRRQSGPNATRPSPAASSPDSVLGELREAHADDERERAERRKRLERALRATPSGQALGGLGLRGGGRGGNGTAFGVGGLGVLGGTSALGRLATPPSEARSSYR